MFENLKSELHRKGITNVAVASLIGCTEKSFQNKIQGVTEFNLSEIFAIRNNLLPEFTFEYLFKATK